MKSLSSMYICGDHVLMHPNQKTKAGYWVPFQPFVKVDKADLAKICETLVCIAKIKSKLTSNVKPAEQLRPLLELSGYSTWTSFAKASKLIFVEAENDLLRLVPQVFDSKTKAFFNSGHIVTTEQSDIGAMKAKVMEAMELCN